MNVMEPENLVWYVVGLLSLPAVGLGFYIAKRAKAIWYKVPKDDL